MALLEKSRRSFIRGVLFPLQERLKHHQTMQFIREMEAAQWLPLPRLRELQDKRVRVLISHGVRTTAYYPRAFRDNGIEPAAIHGVADLQQLPFLTKEIVRGNLEDLKSAEAIHVHRFATGGSTGAPLIFYLGATRESSDVAARWRAEGWWGVGIGDPEFVIWGAPAELKKQDHIRDLRDRFMRTRLLSAFEMNAATMSRYLDLMERSGCRRVFGYPSSIALLCEHARKQGRDLKKLGVKAVFVTAEYLWDHWRKTISEAFGCPVANGYGGRDSGFIAHECPQGGMHITADRLAVEIVSAEGRVLPPGQLGEIVVTHFDTREMPLIRYRTGDMGVLAENPCPCGRTLPLLERVEGRKTDFVIAPDGRVLHGLSLIYILREIEGIEQFRITQKTLREFDIEIVTNAVYKVTSETRIRDGFMQRLRTAVSIAIRYSPQIATSASGKYRYVISEIADDPSQLESVGVSATLGSH